MAQKTIAILDTWRGRSAVPVEFAMREYKPGFEGEVRLRNSSGVEKEGGQFVRIPSGWYVEVFRGESWERVSGPYSGTLMGPDREAFEAAAKQVEAA